MTIQNGLLTIGIPTYNGGDKLQGLLRSIGGLGLSINEYNILIIDNGSTDNTDQVVEELKRDHPNINYHKNPTNIGRIENWNKILELTQGEFLLLMNVNDSFLKFDMKECLDHLKSRPDIPLVMNDVLFENYRYPNWIGKGVVAFDSYISKTFLDVDHLEFNALGVLQQHIYRMDVIRKCHIRFDPLMPRTTDRVFIAQVISNGGGKFYYTGKPIVAWQLNTGRYHDTIHNSNAGFNFDQLWGNEYKANITVAQIAGIPYPKVLKSQMILARFMMFAQWLRNVRSSIIKKHSADKGVEITTANLYYDHLRAMARSNNISINYFTITMLALKRAISLFLKTRNIIKALPRTLDSALITNSSTPCTAKHV